MSQVDGYVFGRMARFAQPLDQRMQEWGIQLDDWFPSLQEVMTGGQDSVRGLQFTTDVRVLYYRRDLIDRPPATWDELISLAPHTAGQRRGPHLPGRTQRGRGHHDTVAAVLGTGPRPVRRRRRASLLHRTRLRRHAERGAATAVVLMLINLVMIFCYLRLVEREERVY
ncbi:MAG: hypothetical protein WA962_07240 [Ornithinimicrobium sp.]